MPFPTQGSAGPSVSSEPLRSISGNARKLDSRAPRSTFSRDPPPTSKRTRSDANVENPSKKLRTSHESNESTKDASTEKPQSKGGISNLSHVHLDGEETDTVPIHDSCGEIRKKISSYLRRSGVEQSSFLKALKDQYHTDKQPARMDPGKLNRFRSSKGADGGNTNTVYYAAYVFFEKLRIKEGKPKSKHRQDMEATWPNGADTRVHAKNKR
ncbi:MAG: hypothetical protein Q9165_006317 [Trypethelium subeluteriae]